MALTETVHAPVTAEQVRAFIDMGKRAKVKRTMLAVTLWELIDRGPALNKEGRATDLLRQRLVATGSVPNYANKVGDPLAHSLSSTLKEMEAVGLIRRDMNGKRCYRIESLVTAQALAAAGYGRRRVDMPAPATDEPLTVVEPEAEPTPPLVLVPRHSTHPSVYPEVDDDDSPLAAAGEPLSSAVHVDTASLQTFGLLVEAMRLVGLAMAQLPALSAPDPGVAQRLATTLEENQRLRHRAARAEDLNVALKAERDGAVRMKQALQANLDNMAKGAFSPEQYRKFIELDRTMRAAPTSAKGD